MAEGRMYTCHFDVTAVTVAVDFFELSPADDKPLAIHYVSIAQTTEIGDAMEEILPINIQRGGTGMTTGTGGTQAAVPVPLKSSDAAAGFTYDTLNTTVATFTAGTVLHRDAFNVRTGWQFLPTPEIRPIVHHVNVGLVVRLGAAPVDSISFTGTLVAEELA